MNYITSFESHLREQGKAEKTIQSYTGDTNRFLNYMESKSMIFEGCLNRFTINSTRTISSKKTMNQPPSTRNSTACKTSMNSSSMKAS